jgi:hypothetical protein
MTPPTIWAVDEPLTSPQDAWGARCRALTRSNGRLATSTRTHDLLTLVSCCKDPAQMTGAPKSETRARLQRVLWTYAVSRRYPMPNCYERKPERSPREPGEAALVACASLALLAPPFAQPFSHPEFSVSPLERTPVSWRGRRNSTTRLLQEIQSQSPAQTSRILLAGCEACLSNRVAHRVLHGTSIRCRIHRDPSGVFMQHPPEVLECSPVCT